MKKKVVLFLVLFLLVSLGINFYLLYEKKNNETYKSNNDIIDVNSNLKNKNNIFEKKIGKENLREVNYFNTIDKNIFELGYLDFKNNVVDYNSYKIWRKKFVFKPFLLGIARLSDEKSWNKYYNFLIDFYTEKDNKDFAEEFRKDANFNRNKNGRKNFMLFISEYFDKIKKGTPIIATIDNINNDMNMSYSTNNIIEAIKLCKSRNKIEFPHIPCIDDSYFYRATKQNNYCEKIKDNYKKRICNDFLEYQEKNK